MVCTKVLSDVRERKSLKISSNVSIVKMLIHSMNLIVWRDLAVWTAWFSGCVKLSYRTPFTEGGHSLQTCSQTGSSRMFSTIVETMTHTFEVMLCSRFVLKVWISFQLVCALSAKTRTVSAVFWLYIRLRLLLSAAFTLIRLVLNRAVDEGPHCIVVNWRASIAFETDCFGKYLIIYFHRMRWNANRKPTG